MNTITTTLTKSLAGLAALSALAVPAGAASSAAAATAVPTCTNAALKASYHYSDAGAGHRYGRIVLTNVSGHSCRLGGFGGLSYVGHGNGTQIGASATRVGGWTAFTLKPGEKAASAVDEVAAGNFDPKTCKPTKVDGFRVYVPNATKSQYVPHRTTGCANAKVHLLSHKAYRKV